VETELKVVEELEGIQVRAVLVVIIELVVIPVQVVVAVAVAVAVVFAAMPPSTFTLLAVAVAAVVFMDKALTVQVEMAAGLAQGPDSRVVAEVAAHRVLAHPAVLMAAAAEWVDTDIPAVLALVV
jgi:hypothetical protein